MIELKNITKIYKTKNGKSVKALDNVSLTLPEKGMVFILGKSGCGKSTMLNILGGLDRQTTGELLIKGRSDKSFSTSDYDSYRNTFVGFIFQEYNVLPEFTVKQNIVLAPELQGKKQNNNDFEKVLSSVELNGLESRKPNTLSGGQKQRITIARALIKNPEIILADEPTGALDSATGRTVLDTLRRLADSKLVVVVSHDRDFAEQYADRIVELHDGKIISDKSRTEEERALTNKVTVMEDGIHLVGEADETLLETLNELLKNKRTATIISEEEGATVNSGHFTETDTENIPKKNYSLEDSRFIRSVFPLKYALRMGASSTKIKPFRLIMTILLAGLALSAFGFSLAMMSYDSTKVLEEGLKSSDYDALAFGQFVKGKEYSFLYYTENNDSEKPVSVEEAEKFLKNLEQEILPIYSFGMSYDSGEFAYEESEQQDSYTRFHYYPHAFSGFTPADKQSLEAVGCPLISGKMPESAEEIAVSRLTAEGFVAEGYKGIPLRKTEELIGKTLTVAGTPLTVVGIFDCANLSADYEFIKNLKDNEMTAEQYDLARQVEIFYNSSFATVAAVHDSFFKTYGKILSLQDNKQFQIGMGSADEFMDYFYLPVKAESTIKDVRFFEEGKTQIGDGEFLVSPSLLLTLCMSYAEIRQYNPEVLFGNDPDKAFLEAQKLLKILEDVGHPLDKFSLEINGTFYTDISLAGIGFEGSGRDKDILILSDRNYKEINPTYTERTEEHFDFFLTPKTDRACALFARSNGKNVKENDHFFALYHNTYPSTVDSYTTVIGICQDIFLNISIVLAVFASLLLFNFISVSITYKKKDIGILRALGARKIDVFKIFFSESLLIIGVCFVVSAILSAVLINYFNYFITAKLGIACALFFYGPLQALAVLLLAIVVAFISTVIPVHLSAKKPPVDAIRAL